MTPEITVRAVIDGVSVPCLPNELAEGQPTIIEGLTWTWGRDTIVDQPDAASASFTIRQQIVGDPDPASLFDYVHVGATVQIFAKATDSGREVTCWVGEVRGATITQVDDRALAADVSCLDSSALLANLVIGDNPWPQQDAYTRFQNIMAAAGLRITSLHPGIWGWDITGDMAETIRHPQIAYRDVDAQPPLDLIHSVAASVGGVAWMIIGDAGPFIWVEDPTQRPALKIFVIDPGTGVVTITDIAIDPATQNIWSAWDVIRDPVTWTQDASQPFTSVDIQWLLPGVDEDGQPTTEEQTYSRDDTAAVARYGVRKLQIDTELARKDDAANLAFQWLAWSRTATWIVSGITIDTAALTRPIPDVTDARRIDELLNLLDIRLQAGLQLAIIDLPRWAPTGDTQTVYIEGGTYTFENRRFQLELTASSNALGGSARWMDMPHEVIWSDMHPDITWIDAYGVKAPYPTEVAAEPETAEVAA